MTELRANNPYAPPAARVHDIHDDQQTQPIKLWSAQGRIGRLRWVAWSIVGSLAIMPLVFIAGILAGVLGSQSLAYGLLGIGYLAYIVFYALLTIQRAHDLDWSGWTALLVLIPLVGLVFMVMRGSAGRNRFGAPPPPNPRGMGWVVAIPVLLFVVGIVAAVALPAYVDTQGRARSMQSR